jgi:hydrogenase nickel incorporation protein HypB
VSRYCEQVEAVCTARPDMSTILSVLPRFQLSKLDILLMDTMATMEEIPDLGQDITVAVLSVGAGDDKAPLYAELLRRADALILNKADLQRHVMFDKGAFWADVRRINPELVLMEVSAFENRGVDRWLAWLDRRRSEKKAQP